VENTCPVAMQDSQHLKLIHRNTLLPQTYDRKAPQRTWIGPVWVTHLPWSNHVLGMWVTWPPADCGCDSVIVIPKLYMARHRKMCTLDPQLTSCVILNKSLNFLSLRFLICKTETSVSTS
jgi:hypothetical protein